MEYSTVNKGVYLLAFCGGLTLAGCQVPTKADLSLPFLSWTGKRKYHEKLMGREKDREITQQLLSRAKQMTWGNQFNLLRIKSE